MDGQRGVKLGKKTFTLLLSCLLIHLCQLSPSLNPILLVDFLLESSSSLVNYLLASSAASQQPSRTKVMTAHGIVVMIRSKWRIYYMVATEERDDLYMPDPDIIFL